MGRAVKIISAVGGTFVLAYVCDKAVSDGKIFGGKTPKTDCREWREATDRQLDAWPRTAGPPVAMNPITRQNYIAKSR
ncbi:hypothetical protein Tsubulata_013337 [Turnera subulata]|uniref:Uncharacterized protein n=1 Tax=Turnera subulata TaxID=218843 RepID=A0A9Q0JHD0_9ROSI|nr:hypothetical protein Tsubulata_013337 [Turnera subulata]